MPSLCQAYRGLVNLDRPPLLAGYPLLPASVEENPDAPTVLGQSRGSRGPDPRPPHRPAAAPGTQPGGPSPVRVVAPRGPGGRVSVGAEKGPGVQPWHRLPDVRGLVRTMPVLPLPPAFPDPGPRGLSRVAGGRVVGSPTAFPDRPAAPGVPAAFPAW